MRAKPENFRSLCPCIIAAPQLNVGNGLEHVASRLVRCYRKSFFEYRACLLKAPHRQISETYLDQAILWVSRVPAHALFSRHDRLLWSPRIDQNPRQPAVAIGQVGGERDCSLAFADRLIVMPLRQIKVTEKHISPGLGVVQGDRLLRRLVGIVESLRAAAPLIKCVEVIGEPDSRVRFGILRVQLDSLLPHFPRFRIILSREHPEVLPPAQIVAIGFEVVGAPKPLEPCLVPQNQLRAYGGYDSPYELVLHREDVVQRAVVALGPQFGAT